MFDSVEIKEVKNEAGQLIKIIRKKRKISQTALAETLDISRNTIQNLESGKNFTIDTLFKVLKEFDMLDKVYDQLLKAKEDLTQVRSLY